MRAFDRQCTLAAKAVAVAEAVTLERHPMLGAPLKSLLVQWRNRIAVDRWAFDLEVLARLVIRCGELRHLRGRTLYLCHPDYKLLAHPLAMDVDVRQEAVL
jgi:hypothetical protein